MAVMTFYEVPQERCVLRAKWINPVSAQYDALYERLLTHVGLFVANKTATALRGAMRKRLHSDGNYYTNIHITPATGTNGESGVIIWFD